jgi:hypothetical protein
VKNFQFQNCLSKTCKNKNGYYHSFKTQIGGRSKAKFGTLVEARVMGRVDPGQRKNKNGYYYSFKLDSGVDLGQHLGHEWS